MQSLQILLVVSLIVTLVSLSIWIAATEVYSTKSASDVSIVLQRMEELSNLIRSEERSKQIL